MIYIILIKRRVHYLKNATGARLDITVLTGFLLVVPPEHHDEDADDDHIVHVSGDVGGGELGPIVESLEKLSAGEDEICEEEQDEELSGRGGT
jgi:hypothetical protein